MISTAASPALSFSGERRADRYPGDGLGPACRWQPIYDGVRRHLVKRHPANQPTNQPDFRDHGAEKRRTQVKMGCAGEVHTYILTCRQVCVMTGELDWSRNLLSLHIDGITTI